MELNNARVSIGAIYSALVRFQPSQIIIGGWPGLSGLFEPFHESFRNPEPLV